MKILGVIPARYQSTRFPGKPLADVLGKSMIMRVYEQALKAKSLDKVVIATDHKEIYNHAKEFDADVIMTGDHETGTDRCKEVLDTVKEKYDFILNVQGDEPFIKPKQIDLLASILDDNTEIATLVKELEKEELLFDPNTPKVVFNKDMEAIYFSRSPIPYLRDVLQSQWFTTHKFYKHIGIYAYKTKVLKEISLLKRSELEKAESLEQLRWIENGYKIKVAVTKIDCNGIDTPEELEKIRLKKAEEANIS